MSDEFRPPVLQGDGGDAVTARAPYQLRESPTGQPAACDAIGTWGIASEVSQFSEDVSEGSWQPFKDFHAGFLS